jgi:CheY-like chemotaxis protein
MIERRRPHLANDPHETSGQSLEPECYTDSTAMALALICTSSPVEVNLTQTVFRRRDFSRHLASSIDDAMNAAHKLHPTLILLDRDTSWAERLIAALRRDVSTRAIPIVVVARGAANASEAALLDSGADTVLRLPADASCEEDLGRLVGVPLRREERVPVQLHMDAQVGDDLIAATILNISQRGMLLHSTVPLHAGDSITFAFRLPGASALVTGSGRVVREATPTLFGIEFLSIDDDDRRRIRSILAPAGVQS